MANEHQGQLKYGELVLLGYNSQLPRGNRGRKRSKFILYQRPVANGIKPLSNSYVKISDLIDRQNNTHYITYKLPEKMAVIAECGKDDSTDMFQVGRSSSSSIDFVLFDNTDASVATISRFACRIIIDRNNPSAVRIYAAGFNDSNVLSLSESALKWKKDDGSMDGLTTNGVLIVHPTGVFCGGDSEYGFWREVSIAGDLYSLRQDKRVGERGKLIDTEDNTLKDGTLINLCGATLLWRSAEGLAKSSDKFDLEELVLSINRDYNHFEGLNLQVPFQFYMTNVVIPRRRSSLLSNKSLPYVHLTCGHVQYYKEHDLEQIKHVACPACSENSIPIPLSMGLEPAFYVDNNPPIYAFEPCGHMATEKTIKFWAKAEIPKGTNSFIAQCPFCAVPLNGWPGYVELKFSFLLNGTS